MPESHRTDATATEYVLTVLRFSASSILEATVFGTPSARRSALFIAFLSFFKPAYAWNVRHGAEISPHRTVSVDADFVLAVFAVHQSALHHLCSAVGAVVWFPRASNFASGTILNISCRCAMKRKPPPMSHRSNVCGFHISQIRYQSFKRDRLVCLTVWPVPVDYLFFCYILSHCQHLTNPH